jgi:hypothetical protein
MVGKASWVKETSKMKYVRKIRFVKTEFAWQKIRFVLTEVAWQIFFIPPRTKTSVWGVEKKWGVGKTFFIFQNSDEPIVQ